MFKKIMYNKAIRRMNLKNIMVQETLVSKNDYLLFEYFGTYTENIDADKQQMLAKDFLKRSHRHDILEIIKIMRTIFAGCTEKHLLLQSQNDKEIVQVQYENGRLTSFVKEEKDKYKIHFDIKTGIDVAYYQIASFPMAYSLIEQMTKNYHQTLKQIDALQNITAVLLNETDKILITAYRLFYRENPDFHLQETRIKVQCMLAILNEFNECLLPDNDFMSLSQSKMPFSLQADQIVTKLYPFTNLANIEVPLEPLASRKISLIGASILNAEEYKQNGLNYLIIFSKTIYGLNHCLPYNEKTDWLSKEIKCSKENVDASLKLAKKINQQIA